MASITGIPERSEVMKAGMNFPKAPTRARVCTITKLLNLTLKMSIIIPFLAKKMGIKIQDVANPSFSMRAEPSGGPAGMEMPRMRGP